MDANELIEEFLAEHVDAIIINPVHIINAKPDPDAADYFRWQYLVTAKSSQPQWY